MSRGRLTALDAGHWRLSGVLDFTTVTRLAAEGRELLRRASSGAEIHVDLSAIEHANSAGLTLLLEWLDIAHARGVRLTYTHVPRSLERIAAFSNLQGLLPVAA